MDGSLRTPTFLFVGNHLCLDFINTQMIIRGNLTDLLETCDDLVAWMVRTDLLSKGEGDAIRMRLSRKEKNQVLEGAKTFRATLREMAEHIVKRKGVPRSVVTEINRLLSQRPGYPQVVRRGTKFEETVISEVVNTDNLLASLARAASDLLCRGNLALIKRCANHACILYFYDTTKSHTRSWCSMQLCGNRVKVAAHYHRKKLAKGR